LSRHPPVGNNSHYGRHKQGNNPLHGVKQTYLGPQANIKQIRPHGSKISPPYGKLQEVHDYQSESHSGNFVFHLSSLMCVFYITCKDIKQFDFSWRFILKNKAFPAVSQLPERQDN
jgi:hypothetical protein